MTTTTTSSPADSNRKEDKGDGLLRLSYALGSNNQHKENGDLMAWLETATVDDLRLAFPVLLNWCRNSLLKSAKSSKNNLESIAAAAAKDADDDSNPILLTPATTAEGVVQKMIKVLDEAIEFDAEDTSIEKEEVEQRKRKMSSISSLRMSLAGYLHTNHDKMREVPVVSNLEKCTKAKVALNRPATNTLNMVNAASSSTMSMSQYITPEQENQDNKNWGIPHINIDLGLGLQQTSPADVCKEYIRDEKPLLHPFTGEKVSRMQVKKVFPSKRKPVWIEYFSSSADGTTEPPLKPDVLAKQGDDLRNDAAVTCVSKLCEDIWAVASIEWTLGAPPSVCAYDVLVTAPDAGYLEMVPGKNFLELSQPSTATASTQGSSEASEVSNQSISTNTGWDGVNVRKLAPSLVGSYIVNFVLGVRDRHEDNMMVVGDLEDDPKMMQIDFGYILMEFPGGVHFDMPRLTMPIALVDRFNTEPGSVSGSTLMEDLQHDMLAAYLVLRRHSNQFVPFCAHLMSSSYEYKYVEEILRGKHVFRTDRSEKHVIKWMSQKLTSQWAHFYFRREIKQSMVSGYYKFVETMTFENKAKESDKKKQSSGNFGEKIRNFFSKKPKNKTTNRDRNVQVQEGSSNDDDDDDDDSLHSIPENTTDKDDSSADMSELKTRLRDAMKLQKEVCSVMMLQKEEHGTLVPANFNSGDNAASVKSA